MAKRIFKAKRSLPKSLTYPIVRDRFNHVNYMRQTKYRIDALHKYYGVSPDDPNSAHKLVIAIAQDHISKFQGSEDEIHELYEEYDVDPNFDEARAALWMAMAREHISGFRTTDRDGVGRPNLLSVEDLSLFYCAMRRRKDADPSLSDRAACSAVWEEHFESKRVGLEALRYTWKQIKKADRESIPRRNMSRIQRMFLSQSYHW